jgi:microcystin degradation protein MlrC
MIVVTDDDQGLAQEIVDDLCKLAWNKRKALTGRERFSLFSVEEGVSRAMERAVTALKPVIVLDHADRTNDTTFVLRELMKRGAKGVAHPVFYDPEAARTCIEAGVGSKVELDVGASTGWRDGGKLHMKGSVLWAGEGKYIGTGPMRRNLEVDHGPTAVIDADGVWLQFTTYKASLIDEDPITQFGRRAQDFDIIVTKSKTHFREVYGEIGEEIVIVDAPGQCPADTTVFEYKNVPEGVYPITKKKSGS